MVDMKKVEMSESMDGLDLTTHSSFLFFFSDTRTLGKETSLSRIVLCLSKLMCAWSMCSDFVAHLLGRQIEKLSLFEEQVG